MLSSGRCYAFTPLLPARSHWATSGAFHLGAMNSSTGLMLKTRNHEEARLWVFTGNACPQGSSLHGNRNPSTGISTYFDGI